MSPITERLRNDVCLLSKLDWQDHVALAREAADTIDALVAALERVRSDGKKYRNVMSGATLAAVDDALALVMEPTP